MPQYYLQKINGMAESALIQTGAVTRCEHHKDVLVHNGDSGAETGAY